MKRFGVIDLGTNTFHLLIAEGEGAGGFEELFRLRQFVKLAEGGIETISLEAFQRGLKAICHFHSLLTKYAVQEIRATGTAALRTASNGLDFIRQVKEQTGIQVELISGKREAELIYKGVIQAIPTPQHRILILDIGGGSCEFIMADQDGLIWAGSFPVGLAVLLKKFHHNDPVTNQDIKKVHQFLDQQLQPLLAILSEHPTNILVGASGTFDVLADISGNGYNKALHTYISAPDFHAVYRRYYQTTRQYRKELPEIPDDRIDMFVMALVLIDFIIRIGDFREIIVSTYAMKEGILAEMIRSHKLLD